MSVSRVKVIPTSLLGLPNLLGWRARELDRAALNSQDKLAAEEDEMQRSSIIHF